MGFHQGFFYDQFLESFELSKSPIKVLIDLIVLFKETIGGF